MTIVVGENEGFNFRQVYHVEMRQRETEMERSHKWIRHRQKTLKRLSHKRHTEKRDTGEKTH
jgi:hypothetical protein